MQAMQGQGSWVQPFMRVFRMKGFFILIPVDAARQGWREEEFPGRSILFASSTFF